MANGVAAIARLWDATAHRLAARCEGLGDGEFFWRPVDDCWTVRRGADGAWTYDYEWPAPQPAPVTTIGWRLVHIAADNWIYWEWAFGPAVRTFPDVAVPSSVAGALQNWQDSRAPITAWLASASDRELAEPRPSHLGAPRTAGEVIAILLDEQIHHGAEIALLRDLYRRRSSTTPPDGTGAS
jgi:hypothetical protein